MDASPLRNYELVPRIEIAEVNYDPAGVDLPNEWASIHNLGERPLALANWRLHDLVSHNQSKPFSFTFPEFVLPAGGTVRVWTRAGVDSETDVYWGRDKAVWNNTGDTAVLIGDNGIEVARLSFPVYVDAVSPPVRRLAVDQTVSVPEGLSQVNTEIDFNPGDEFALDAGGEIRAGVWLTGFNGPAGWDNIDRDPKFPLQGSHPYALIGRFGANGSYFYVGGQVPRRRFGGADVRRLYLRTNDDSPGNGEGAFTCRIRIWR